MAKKIAEKVKSNSKIYNSISDAYFDGQFSIVDDDIFDFKFLLSICGLSLSVLNCLMLFYLFRKLKALSTLVFISQNAHAVETKFHYASDKLNDQTSNDNDWQVVSGALVWDHIIFIAYILIVLALIALVVRRTWCKHRANTVISLEIANGSDCVDVCVIAIPPCPDFNELRTPQIISQISVIGSWWPISSSHGLTLK